ncbi:MAG TPA: uracil-DNA glycosylase [Longimicrobiaceae bacterium]
MRLPLPGSWQDLLAEELEKPYFPKLREFVEKERREHTVYPPEGEEFTALELTPFERVSVVILGQDPYHGPGQAHGLAFSVRPGVRPPPSLRNVFRELGDDRGCRVPNNGYLVPWAEQGVLLLNTVLTVREAEPNSHKGKGWERFTDAVIAKVGHREDRVVFVLWGANAWKKTELIDTDRHVVVRSVHPSPLSAKRGFLGSRPFSQIDAALREAGKPAIDWQIPDL